MPTAHQVEDSSVTVMHLNIRPVERAESSESTATQEKDEPTADSDFLTCENSKTKADEDV